ncbi:MAG: efflux RND transporter periplasmic adaptor subunit [Planctomycetia bacterium]|nr:efflux RND transporter periplasmic adaptor subunit [Planctomycetia bacterium]
MSAATLTSHHDAFREASDLKQTVRDALAFADQMNDRSEQVDRLTPPGSNKPAGSFGWKTLAGVLVVAVVVLLQPWKLLHSETIAATGTEAAAVKTVKIDRPSPAATSEVVLPATLRPWQTTTLHARVSGYLTAWHKDLGAKVKAGEVLAEIETPELDQELAEGEATAMESLSAVVQAKAERQEAEAELNVAEAQLNRARADAELAISQLGRRERLLVSSAISQEEYDTFQKQVEARNADVAAAQADVARRRTGLSTKAAIIEAREAAAKSRQANVERLKETLRFKKIVAPFDGIVTGRSAEVGMLVTAGKEALFVVEDMTRIRVQVNVPQAYAVQTGRGTSALVRIPEAALSTTGTVTRTSESVDAANRTMLAEIELDNTTLRFQPGSYVQVTFTAKQSGTAWTIPANTLQMRVEGPHVAVVNAKNEVEIKRVELGRDLGRRIVINAGVRGDERLIVNPDEELRNGLVVQVAPSAPVGDEIAQRTNQSGE